MYSFKVCILHYILVLLVLVNGEVTKQQLQDTTKANETLNSTGEGHNTSTSKHDYANRPRPNVGTSNPLSTNIFHNFFNQLLRPTKIAGKTYGAPSVIAIIGDKPYISLEVFNKFSPFRWLMHAFQAKVNNICGFISHPEQGDSPIEVPEGIFGQEGQNQKPLSGFGQALMGTGPIRIYDIPVNYKNIKHQRPEYT